MAGSVCTAAKRVQPGPPGEYWWAVSLTRPRLRSPSGASHRTPAGWYPLHASECCSAPSSPEHRTPYWFGAHTPATGGLRVSEWIRNRSEPACECSRFLCEARPRVLQSALSVEG